MPSVCGLDGKQAVCLQKGLNTYVDWCKTGVRLRNLTSVTDYVNCTVQVLLKYKMQK